MILVWATVVLAATGGGDTWTGTAVGVVEVEEAITSYTPADNGAGPTWCYGSTIVARQGDDVYVSMIETGKDVPPLCNTRWQLWKRGLDEWKLVQQEKEYRQREPCPIALFHAGSVLLSVNPSTHPPGTRYGPCQPLVIEFNPADLSAAPILQEPVFTEGTDFTDHSYRGFAADGVARELLLLNINAKTGVYWVSQRDAGKAWHARGTIEFPIRACYPQVALRQGAAHVLAIGDIVEPNEEWRKLKFEKLKSSWDYVFRRLFYTYTPDVATRPFSTPLEIDSVEQTAGSISNLDLHVDAADRAHLLYLRRPHQYAFIRDQYFPGQPMVSELVYKVLHEGKVVSQQTLAQTPQDCPGFDPAFARFHVMPDDRLLVVAGGTLRGQAGNPISGNFLATLPEANEQIEFKPLKMTHPFGTFFTSTPRGGTKPSTVIDIVGTTNEPLTLRYARVRLTTSTRPSE